MQGAEGQDNSLSFHEESLSPPFLSIIIPAFNEEKRLPDTLTQITAFVKSQPYRTEIITVDNASTDLTRKIVTDFVSLNPFVRYLYEATRGKGAAVKAGILAGQGDYLLISDADLAVPTGEISNFLPPHRDDYDVAIGSREVAGARRYDEPFYRHFMGRVFNLIVRWLVLPDIRDTQCGFKCFKRAPAHELFGESNVAGWGFDVEILCMARQRGYRIVEVPVSWYYGKESKVRPLRDACLMLMELASIRKKRRRGEYDKKTGR